MNKVFIDRFTDPTPISYEVVTGPIGAETDKARILRTSGPLGPTFVEIRKNLFDGPGGPGPADCHNIDSYSYGSVSLSRFSGTVTITLKDQNGNTIHDELNSSKECKKTFGPSDFPPESTSQVNDPNKMNINIEKLSGLWKDLQGEKSTSAIGLLNPETGLSGLNTDPFAHTKSY